MEMMCTRPKGKPELTDFNYDFAAEHYADFLREVGAGLAAGRIRYREDIVDGLENAPGAFIGMLEGHNFGKLIVRVTG
jgi:NADPH-dependent curcumin reductase CurA